VSGVDSSLVAQGRYATLIAHGSYSDVSKRGYDLPAAAEAAIVVMSDRRTCCTMRSHYAFRRCNFDALPSRQCHRGS
jgi:hypothetical protein